MAREKRVDGGMWHAVAKDGKLIIGNSRAECRANLKAYESAPVKKAPKKTPKLKAAESPSQFEFLYVLRQIKKVSEAIDSLPSLSIVTVKSMMALHEAPKGYVLTSDITRVLGCSEGSTTGIVDNLVKQGWVARVRVEEDRRQVRLTLTDEGKKKAYWVSKCVAANETYFVDWLVASQEPLITTLDLSSFTQVGKSLIAAADNLVSK